MSGFSELDLSDLVGHLDTVDVKRRDTVAVQVYTAYGKVNHASYYFCPYCRELRNIAISTQKLSGSYPFCDCTYRNVMIQLPREVAYDIHTSDDKNEIIIQGEIHTVELTVSGLSLLLSELRAQEMELDSVIEVNV